MTEKLELYIDIANGTTETGLPPINDKYKTIVQLLALIKEKDYANINIMCLETTLNGIYDCLYNQDNCVSTNGITKAAEKYNKEAFAAPTTKVDKPALVFIEKDNTGLLEKESFKNNILGNKKAIIIQYTKTNLMPLIIILSLIAYNSLDNQVIMGLGLDRRNLSDIQLDFADPKLVHLTAANTEDTRKGKLTKLTAHAKYLQMVPKLAEIKELEVVTAQFEAKLTLEEIKKQNPNAMKGGARPTNMPDPMSIVIKILNIIGAVIIPEEVSNVVIKAQGRNPDKYFKKEDAALNTLSRELIMEYVLKYYTQKETNFFDNTNKNTTQRKKDLTGRQWKFLKEPKNISKIRYCKLAIEHIERRFRNKGFTIDETFTNNGNKDLYDKIMNYDINFDRKFGTTEYHAYPQESNKPEPINIMLMDKDETKKDDTEYIAYVMDLLTETHNDKETVMLYSKESIGTLKLLFNEVPKEPTEADYNYMFENTDYPSKGKKGIVSGLKEGAKQTKKALERLAGKYSTETKKRKHREAALKKAESIEKQKSTEGLAKSYRTSDINPGNIKETSTERRTARKELMEELKTKIPDIKAKGNDIIGYKALSVDELNRLKDKYSNINAAGMYKNHRKDISKDLGITLDDEALKTNEDAIKTCMNNLHLYYTTLADIIKLTDNGKYVLSVGGKEYDLRVSTDTGVTTITFPYPTKAKYLGIMRETLTALHTAATTLHAEKAEEAAARQRADEDEAAGRAAEEEANAAITTDTTGQNQNKQNNHR